MYFFSHFYFIKKKVIKMSKTHKITKIETENIKINANEKY